MIPKTIYFIWFGNKLPNYSTKVINTYKLVNPDFDIKLIYYPDPDNICDDELLYCKNEFLKSYKSDGKLKFWVAFSDFYRFYLLNKYGGIYLDLDTFPIRPFDDKLLSMDKFIVTRLTDAVQCFSPWKDLFFIGSKVSNLSMSQMIDRSLYYPLDTVYEKYSDNRFLELKNKFMNCELNYGDHYNQLNCYIDHYNHFSWNYFEKDKCLAPNSRYDK